VDTALVTGGANGIGLAIANALARGGAAVFAADVREPPAPRDPAEAHPMFVQADVSDAAAIDALFDTIDARTPGVDLLVNNAGILRPQKLADISRDEWARTLRVNLEAMFFAAQRAAVSMRRRGGGSIVNIASTSAFVSSPGQSVYEISKAGVTALTRALALELAPDAIRVNAVAPGLIDTGLTRALFGTLDRLETRAREKVPLGRAGTPGEIADVVLFLASADADYITGQTLVVDGGWLLKG
jgi:NAD(P)-dependent dehydrogenase (short-subunit alcohol dehydrogenase family)